MLEPIIFQLSKLHCDTKAYNPLTVLVVKCQVNRNILKGTLGICLWEHYSPELMGREETQCRNLVFMDILPHLINDLRLYKNRYHRKEMQWERCVCVREREREMEREGGRIGWEGEEGEKIHRRERGKERQMERGAEEGSGGKRKDRETETDRQ